MPLALVCAGCKAFYMRLNDDNATVGAMDVLFPRVGEMVGGSQREERLDVLLVLSTEIGASESSIAAAELGQPHGLAVTGVEHPDAIVWRPLFSVDRLREYVRLCPRAYVEFVGPRSFLQCLALVDKVAGTENVALMIEPASIKVGPSGLLSTGNFDFDRFDESCDTFSRSGSKTLQCPGSRIRTRHSWPFIISSSSSGSSRSSSSSSRRRQLPATTKSHPAVLVGSGAAVGSKASFAAKRTSQKRLSWARSWRPRVPPRPAVGRAARRGARTARR